MLNNVKVIFSLCDRRYSIINKPSHVRERIQNTFFCSSVSISFVFTCCGFQSEVETGLMSLLSFSLLSRSKPNLFCRPREQYFKNKYTQMDLVFFFKAFRRKNSTGLSTILKYSSYTSIIPGPLILY